MQREGVTVLRCLSLCRLSGVLCAAEVATLPGRRTLLILKGVNSKRLSHLLGKEDSDVQAWEAGFPWWKGYVGPPVT